MRDSSSTSETGSRPAASRDSSGLAFDPKYATNRFIYVNYTDESGDTRVVRYKTNGTRALPASARELLRVDQPYANHNGGGLAFGPDGFLYVGTGDGGGGGDPENRAQNMKSLLGKMLRLDVRRPGSDPEIVGLGLRNPWRYSFDRLTGDLYIGDVGQGDVEEVSFTPRSSPGLENYGWDIYEGSRQFEEKAPGPGSSCSRSSSTAEIAVVPSWVVSSIEERHDPPSVGATSSATSTAGSSGASASRAVERLAFASSRSGSPMASARSAKMPRASSTPRRTPASSSV